MRIDWDVTRMPRLDGLRYLVTGANSGVGYGAALELARHGAVVMLACRDKARGEAALARLRREASGAGADASEVVELNLASLASVQRVVDREVSGGLALDGLINNAGVMAPPKRLETEDGFELQWGTNVVGHAVLTCGLLPALERADGGPAGEPRVVTLASIAHKRGRIDFADLQHRARYNPMEAYAQSKLGDLLFALELDARLQAKGMRTRSIAVHPGVARTNLFKVGSGMGLARVAERVIAGSIGFLLNSEAGGAVPTLFAATTPDAKGGEYYGPQGFQEMRGGDVGVAWRVGEANDAEVRRRVWELVGCKAF